MHSFIYLCPWRFIVLIHSVGFIYFDIHYPWLGPVALFLSLSRQFLYLFHKFPSYFEQYLDYGPIRVSRLFFVPPLSHPWIQPFLQRIWYSERMILETEIREDDIRNWDLGNGYVHCSWVVLLPGLAVGRVTYIYVCSCICKPQNQLRKYWVVFQRQQPQTVSHTAKVCAEERTLTFSCIWNQSLSSYNIHRTKEPGYNWNLNTRTLLKPNGPFPRKIQCWCLLSINGEVPRSSN